MLIWPLPTPRAEPSSPPRRVRSAIHFGGGWVHVLLLSAARRERRRQVYPTTMRAIEAAAQH